MAQGWFILGNGPKIPWEDNGRWKKSIKSDQTSCLSRYSSPVYGWDGLELKGYSESILQTILTQPFNEVDARLAAERQMEGLWPEGLEGTWAGRATLNGVFFFLASGILGVVRDLMDQKGAGPGD